MSASNVNNLKNLEFLWKLKKTLDSIKPNVEPYKDPNFQLLGYQKGFVWPDAVSLMKAHISLLIDGGATDTELLGIVKGWSWACGLVKGEEL